MKFKIALLLIITSFFFQLGCISYRKRPAALYNKIIQEKKVFDAGIVPGVPFKNGRWDTVMKGRVIWANFLYKQGIIKNIIFSGAAVYSPYYESKIMGLYAAQLGVPKDRIFFENKAEHSTENIFYSYSMAKEMGFKTIALVTNPFQSSLTKGFTKRRFRSKIYHLPFLVDTLKKYSHLEPVIDPSPAFDNNFKSILQREKWFRRLRGTMGAFIPWTDKWTRKESPL